MGKSRKDYEKYLNSISPDRDDEAWIIGGRNRYCGRENYGTMIKRYDPIYYPHTNTLSFNWNDYGGKITQEEFDDFVNNVDRSQLPEGIKFELK